MSNPGYLPYEPQLTPVQWADEIWTVDGPEVEYRLALATIPCPTRMTIVRFPNGKLWLHSPVAYSKSLADALEDLGEISAIVAPNSFHHIHVSKWKSAYKNATVHSGLQLAERLGKLGDWSAIDAAKPSNWDGTFDYVVCDLGQFEEIVFFHRPTSTLIVTDLMQNFEARRIQSPITRFLLWVGGATGPNGRASIEIRLAGFGRRKKLREALEQIARWQPSSIILSHGLCFKTDAMIELRRAFAWIGPQTAITFVRPD